MNTQLVNYFLSMPKNAEMMNEVSYYDIIPALNKHFNGQWAWEITDERFAMDNSVVSTTVAIYIPGRVLTGRALSKIKEYGENHLRAIVDACSVITLKSVQVTDPQTNTISNQQMSAEQIMAIAGGQNPGQAPINSIPQMDNYKDNHGVSVSEVPFDQITDNCANQMTAAMFGNPPQQAQQNTAPSVNINQQNTMPQHDSAYTQPNPALNGYSQCQVDRMNNVKKSLEIINDNMLNNWINTWNSNFVSKKDLNPANIDKFLDWAEDFAKNM